MAISLPSPQLLCFHILFEQCTLCFGLCILDGYWCFIHGSLSESQSNELKTGDNTQCLTQDRVKYMYSLDSGSKLRKNNIDAALSGCQGGWGILKSVKLCCIRHCWRFPVSNGCKREPVKTNSLYCSTWNHSNLTGVDYIYFHFVLELNLRIFTGLTPFLSLIFIVLRMLCCTICDKWHVANCDMSQTRGDKFPWDRDRGG